jgi:dTDP-4-amino-4,6-dideoxygalactose transaminase
MIRLTRPYFDDTEEAAVRRVLASGMLVQSEEVRAFEESVARYLEGLAPGRGAIEAYAVASGTHALELALMACGTRPGDEVVVPAVTWPSPGNAVILRGATPVLVDVDPETFNLDPRRVAEVLTPHTRAIVAIDQFGVPAEIPALRQLAGDVEIIEDAACALGSMLHGLPCGLLGDQGTFSFHPRKVITTGEGGMVVTRDRRRGSSVRALRNHGQDEPGLFRDAGPNARMSELHAALGRAQMAKLETILARRRAMAEEIRAAVPLAWQRAPAGAVVNHQTLGFVLPAPERGTRAEARAALIAALRTDGIEAGALSYALHRLPQFAQTAVNVTRRFPIADAVVDGGVAVPLHPGMGPADVHTVIDGLRRHAQWALGRPAITP